MVEKKSPIHLTPTVLSIPSSVTLYSAGKNPALFTEFWTTIRSANLHKP